ncbi:MAG: hypothetical protein LBD93_02525 [Treponema sp.]|jgi:hypothetical protein|nr:hypothetical protein [Treponema sp.]
MKYLWGLFALVLLWGCSNPGDPVEPLSGDPLDTRLIGAWRSLPRPDAEGYDITGTTLAYTDGDEDLGWDFDYEGAIRYTKRFNDSEGVIIIEYTKDGWPKYTEAGHTVSAWVGTPIPGPFFGIYYSDLTEDSVALSNATTLDSKPPYAPPETETLEEAIGKFTEQARDRFIAGVTVPQQRYPPAGE